MEVPSELVGTLQEIFANGLIGYAVATTMYGITVLQTYLYYRRYPHDHPLLKILVAILWLLDTLTTVLMSHSLYTFFVLNLRNLAEDVQLPWSFTLENGVTDLITTMVQIYFAERLWRLSRGNKLLSGAIVILALISLALGIQGTVKVFNDHNLISESFQHALVLGGAVQGVAVLCDILITGGLCYYIGAQRTGDKPTNVLLDKLMAYAIERGALTGTVQTLYLIMSVALPKRFFYVPFAMIVAKMYVNTLLASLNVRGTWTYGSWEGGHQSSVHFKTQAASTTHVAAAVKSIPSDPSGSTTQLGGTPAESTKDIGFEAK